MSSRVTSRSWADSDVSPAAAALRKMGWSPTPTGAVS